MALIRDLYRALFATLAAGAIEDATDATLLRNRAAIPPSIWPESCMGFNTTPATLRGLGGRKYGADFLKATYVEGFSRLAEPVRGRPYLSYDGKFHTRILGNRNNTLLDRESIAVHRGNPLFSKTTRTWILDPAMYNQFGATRFQVGDTGGGLFRSQIDLYWGEDDPLGPGSDIWRPASCDVAVSWIVPVLVWP